MRSALTPLNGNIGRTAAPDRAVEWQRPRILFAWSWLACADRIIGRGGRIIERMSFLEVVLGRRLASSEQDTRKIDGSRAYPGWGSTDWAPRATAPKLP